MSLSSQTYDFYNVCHYYSNKNTDIFLDCTLDLYNTNKILVLVMPYNNCIPILCV